MKKAYKYRLYPTEEQKEFLNQNFNATRYIYNQFLQFKIEWWENNKDLPKEERDSKAINNLQDLLPLFKNHDNTKWLKEADSMGLVAANAELKIAFDNFFRRLKCGKTGKKAGYPKFKSKFDKNSYHPAYNNFKYNFEKGTVTLAKIGEIKCIFHREFKGDTGTITVSKITTDKYYISILVEDYKEEPKKKKIREETTIGIDWGVKKFATLSNETEIENPKLFQKWKKIIKKEERSLSRKRKFYMDENDPNKYRLNPEGYRIPLPLNEQSKSYHKQKLKVGKLKEHVVNQRKDFLHNTSADLIQKYDTLCIEDLNVKGMTSSAAGTIENPGKGVAQKSGLNRSILDVAPSEFFRQLRYKSNFKGKNVLNADKFFASSKLCSCGYRNNALTLADRIWGCPECGKVNQRDLNAAINIKTFCLNNLK